VANHKVDVISSWCTIESGAPRRLLAWNYDIHLPKLENEPMTLNFSLNMTSALKFPQEKEHNFWLSLSELPYASEETAILAISRFRMKSRMGKEQSKIKGSEASSSPPPYQPALSQSQGMSTFLILSLTEFLIFHSSSQPQGCQIPQIRRRQYGNRSTCEIHPETRLEQTSVQQMARRISMPLLQLDRGRRRGARGKFQRIGFNTIYDREERVGKESRKRCGAGCFCSIV